MDIAATKRKRAQTIAQLQSEINDLSARVKQEQAKKKRAKYPTAAKIIQHLLDSSPSSENVDDLTPIDKLELLDEENHVQFITKLAAITTKDVHSSLVYIDERKEIMRRYTLQATSTTVPFTLVFDVDEANKHIESINVTMQDSVKAEIAPLIKTLEETKSVISFVQNFNRYTELRQHRHNVFSELAAAYPENIQLKHGSYSRILSYEVSGQHKIGFVVEWKLSVLHGRVHQDISLSPVVTEEALGADLKNEIRNIPNKFWQLVSTKGPKAAIEIFITLGLQTLS